VNNRHLLTENLEVHNTTLDQPIIFIYPLSISTNTKKECIKQELKFLIIFQLTQRV